MHIRLELLSCVLLFLAFGIGDAFPYPAREIRSPVTAISASYPDLSPVIRGARAAEEPKNDLEGSESALVAYPYWGWPYYSGYYAPQVVYVG